MDLQQIYPPDKLQSHLFIVSFQESLIKLNKNNIEKTSQVILQTPLVSHPDLVRRIAFDILYVASIRPGHIPYLVSVIKYLIDRQSSGNALSELKNLIVPTDIPNQRWYRSFLINCIIKQVITTDDFMSLLTSFPLGESLYLIFCWFAPFIESCDEEVFGDILSEFMEEQYLTPELSFFRNNLDQMHEMKWNLQRIYFQNGYNDKTLAYYIKNDKLEELVKMISTCESTDDKIDKGIRKKNIDIDEDDDKSTENTDERSQKSTIANIEEESFDYNQRIESSLFERCHFLRHSPTLLQFAAFFSSKKCYGFLLSKGADIKIKDDEGKSLLQFAIAGGNTKLFNMYIEKESIDEEEFKNSIRTSIEYCRFNMMVALIDKLTEFLIKKHKILEKYQSELEADFEAKFEIKLEPPVSELIVKLKPDESLELDDEYISEILSDLRFRIQSDLLSLFPPLLHYAAQYNNIRAILYFLEHEWPINFVDDDGRTPLHYAAEYCQMDSIFALIDANDTDVNAKDNNGNTPLHLAVKNNKLESIQALAVHSNLDLNSCDLTGNNSVMIAAKRGFDDIVYYLLNHEIDVNHQNILGLSSLHFAVQKRQENIVSLLLTHNYIDVNLQDQKGVFLLIF